MTEAPSAQRPDESAEPAQPIRPKEPPKQTRARRYVIPAIFLALTAVLGLVSWALWPQDKQLPSPATANFSVESKTPVGLIGYFVTKSVGSIYRITVTVDVFPGTTGFPSNHTPASLLYSLPRGSRPLICDSDCLHLPSLYDIHKPLVFDSAGTASVSFLVEASDFGATSGGGTASAAIPEVQYNGPGTPNLQVHYGLAHAIDYDWASFPTAFADDLHATWEERIVGGEAPARIAVGINHTEQSRNDLRIFVAGALIAIAGGALIACIQETLHMGD